MIKSNGLGSKYVTIPAKTAYAEAHPADTEHRKVSDIHSRLSISKREGQNLEPR
jgi:hypothetical protein